MSNCDKCIWYGQCQTYANCEDFTPIECDLDAALVVLKQDYRAAFWEYLEELQDERKFFSIINTYL